MYKVIARLRKNDECVDIEFYHTFASMLTATMNIVTRVAKALGYSAEYSNITKVESELQR